MPKILYSEYNKIAELYNSGVSQESIKKIYNCGQTAITTVLHKQGIELRDDSHKKRKYLLNENYFDNIDTSNKAYTLGLFYADGCNYMTNNNIFIELQELDKDILEKINADMQSDRNLKINKLHDKNIHWQNSYRLCITNKHMSEQLFMLGVVPRKSLILKFPNFIPDCFLRDFIRGYFDGDGCIEWNKSKFLTVASTSEFCNSLKQILFLKLNIHSSVVNTANKSSNTKILEICGKKQIIQFLDYIYDNSELHIDRKYNHYLQIKESLNK